MLNAHDWLEHSPGAAFVLDARLDQATFGHFEALNGGLEPLTGWPPSVLVGRPFWHVLPEADAERIEAYLRQRAAARDWPEQLTATIEHRNGTTASMVIAFAPDTKEADAAGRPLRVYALGLPIALDREHVSLVEAKSEALQNANLELHQIHDRHNRLLARLGHDLRNAMTAMLGFSMALEERLSEPTAGRSGEPVVLAPDVLADLLDMAGHLRAAAEGATVLLDNLVTQKALSMGKQVMVPSEVRLWDVIQEVWRLERERYERKHVVCEFDVENGLRLLVDPAGIHQLLANLLSNARKFSKAGRTVRVRARTTPDSAELVVSDEGVGISPEKIAALYDLNAATSTPGTAGERGTGFGLPICHEILAAHGGVLLVESEPGQGATFTARLPQPPVIESAHDGRPMAISQTPKRGAV